METINGIRSQFSVKGFLYQMEALWLFTVTAALIYLCYCYFFRGTILVATWIWLAWGLLLLAPLPVFLHATYLFVRQRRIITITDSHIEYRYLFFPFISWKHNIDEYDKIVHVEVTRYDGVYRTDYSGVWLVKKGKVKIEIYQHVYENYEELIAAIHLPHVRSNPKYIYGWEYFPYIHGKKKVKTRKIESKPPKAVQP